MKNLFLITSLLAVTSLGCQTYTDSSEQDLQIIKENAAAFSGYIMAGDYDSIMMAYTEDGKIFPNRSDIIEGRENIRPYWVQPDGYGTKHHKLIPEEIKILGDEAYDYGRYEGISVDPEGNESSWRGKYVVVWKKVDGDWKMYLDIWNSIE